MFDGATMQTRAMTERRPVLDPAMTPWVQLELLERICSFFIHKNGAMNRP